MSDIFVIRSKINTRALLPSVCTRDIMSSFPRCNHSRGRGSKGAWYPLPHPLPPASLAGSSGGALGKGRGLLTELYSQTHALYPSTAGTLFHQRPIYRTDHYAYPSYSDPLTLSFAI